MRLLTVVLCVVLAGCGWNAKDAPWDPDLAKGESLLDQIPNWSDEGLRCLPGTTAATLLPECSRWTVSGR